jgi:hypothetical protein
VPTTLEDLRERINLRLEDSFVGISEQVADLAAEDLVELLNQLTLIEAASVVMMLPVGRAVELFDQPTMSRRGRATRTRTGCADRHRPRRG